MMCRRFHGEKVTRIIVTVPYSMHGGMLRAMSLPGHPSRGCQTEFVRLAIAEKIGRDLMLSQAAPPREAKARPDSFSPTASGKAA